MAERFWGFDMPRDREENGYAHNRKKQGSWFGEQDGKNNTNNKTKDEWQSEFAAGQADERPHQ